MNGLHNEDVQNTDHLADCPDTHREHVTELLEIYPEWTVQVTDSYFAVEPTVSFSRSIPDTNRTVKVRISPETSFSISEYGRVVESYYVAVIANGNMDMTQSTREQTLADAFTTAATLIEIRS